MPSNPLVNALSWTAGNTVTLAATSTGYVMVKKIEGDNQWLVELFVARELNDAGWSFTPPNAATDTWRALEVPAGFSINNGEVLAASLKALLLTEGPLSGGPVIVHGRP